MRSAKEEKMKMVMQENVCRCGRVHLLFDLLPIQYSFFIYLPMKCLLLLTSSLKRFSLKDVTLDSSG